MKIYSVDRIEEGIAVLLSDDGETIVKPINELSFPVHEGSILHVSGDDFVPDPGLEASRRQHILSLQEKLRNKNK